MQLKKYDEERMLKIAFILLAGCLSALWEFMKEKSPLHRYSRCPDPAVAVGLQALLETLRQK